MILEWKKVCEIISHTFFVNCCYFWESLKSLMISVGNNNIFNYTVKYD